MTAHSFSLLSIWLQAGAIPEQITEMLDRILIVGVDKAIGVRDLDTAVGGIIINVVFDIVIVIVVVVVVVFGIMIAIVVIVNC